MAFFFILYGIAFEALITKPDSNSQDVEDQTLEILLALKKILRPSVSGNAIYQDVVFSETMEVLDRLAQTEGYAVQAAIVEIARNLCLSHPSVDEEAGDEHLSDDLDQLFELTRLIVLVVAGVLPNLGEKPTPVRQDIPEEAVDLIKLSLDALVDAVDVFPSVIRSDLHACIIHIFTTILGTGACQLSVVPRALPIFKRFILSVTDELEENDALGDQIRICLQRFRSILLNAQRRETEASLQCACNTLMASVILLTTGSDAITPGDPLVVRLLDDLLDCLPDRGLGKVAANCVRSLLLVESKTATGQAIVQYLLPRLIQFLMDDEQLDPENTKAVILPALTSYIAMLEGDAFMAMLCFLIPLLLHRASSVGKSSYQDIAARLLAIAGKNQGAFKGVVSKMTAEQRTIMEEVIRIGGSSGRGTGSEGDERAEPTIALKFTFGGK